MQNPFKATNGVALIGLGNILMRDDGVGVHAVRYIQSHRMVPPGLEIVEGGTTGLDLLPFIEGRDRVLFIDAVNFNETPGFIKVLKNEAIPAFFNTKDSLHHLGLADVLAAARLLDILSKDIRLIGIQPEKIEPGLTLSGTIQARVKALADQALSESGCS
jgi:hydrogenase maturation protease